MQDFYYTIMSSLGSETKFLYPVSVTQSISSMRTPNLPGRYIPGKGAAFVRTKIRNVITGAVVEKTFNPNDKYPTAFIDRKDMEYSYSDGDLYYFMDTETWEIRGYQVLHRDLLHDRNIFRNRFPRLYLLQFLSLICIM